MIDVHFANSPNGRKVTIMLEEIGHPYNLIKYDFRKGEHLTREFRRINPNGRIPAIVDHEPIGGGEPYTVFESGAILFYLAEKSGKFLPRDPRGRHLTMQWLMWQMSGLGPMHGQAHHFTRQAPEPVDPYALRRYRMEAERLLFVLNRRLRESEYVAGPEYTIADIAIWPWLYVLYVIEIKIADFPNIQRWFDIVSERPGIKAGCRIPYDAKPGKIVATPEGWSNSFGDNMHAFHRRD